ncbi:MAG: response regulator [Patescibacteria group bacterium]
MKRRLLFVDDEPKILEGLKRMLRGMRHEWVMEFAESGKAALEKLTQESFDVVVSDMRMPGMDGAQLLNEVKKHYPHVVRIILSGHSDQELILKSVRLAHRYLAKPCDTEALKTSVSRAVALKDLLTSDSIRRIISQMDSIPSLPSLYAEVMEAVQSPDASLNKVGRIIAKDMGMTAKILHLVNSAFFGIPRHVSNPEQAVSLLGLDTVKALVLTVGVFSKFDKAKIPAFSIKNLWTHSLIAGAYAKEIAGSENVDRISIDDAFMAGLLHDIGKLVMATYLTDEYTRVTKHVQDEKLPFYKAEQKVFDTTHAEVGAYLLGLWGLSNSIVEAVGFHHLPLNFPQKTFSPLTAVHFANVFEHERHLSLPTNLSGAKTSDPYLEQLSLGERLPVWREICCQIKHEESMNG